MSGDGGSETANVGVSSFRNSGNRLLLLAEARLVTAHEIGEHAHTHAHTHTLTLSHTLTHTHTHTHTHSHTLTHSHTHSLTGHGWGSEHDPTTGFRACDPPVGRNQGKYLMFPSATDGDQRNNDVSISV